MTRKIKSRRVRLLQFLLAALFAVFAALELHGRHKVWGLCIAAAGILVGLILWIRKDRQARQADGNSNAQG
jgi:glucose uptake protein GlcU